MKLLLGDCKNKLKELEDNSIDSIVTDPPYGISFMGKKWDYDVPQVEVWKECLRVLKPGGYLLSFAGTRTQHRMAVNIEDAGFEIRDMIAWVYGSGFPKSLNIGKSVDKLQGNEREMVGKYIAPDGKERGGMPNNLMDIANNQEGDRKEHKITKGTSEWEGWGTALKPALEPITVARKPIEGTVAENCLKWGVGGINIDGCRVETEELKPYKFGFQKGSFNDDGWKGKNVDELQPAPSGRFPANLIHDGSEEVVGLFPQTGKSVASNRGSDRNGNVYGKYNLCDTVRGHNDNGGSASRFFYCAKASKRERNIGCEGLELTRHADRNIDDGVGGDNPRNRTNTPKQNFHPTVKPIALMEYLVKLVSREGQVVLDPFMGSGTTGMACKKLGRDFVGIEMEEEYIEIAKARIEGTDRDKPKEQLNLV